MRTCINSIQYVDTMPRVSIWISPLPSVSDALIIRQPNGAEEYFAFRSPAQSLNRLGSSYPRTLQGIVGTAYDLPGGFPTNDAEASRRLNDPSIPSLMQALIRLNFPLQDRSRPDSRPRRIA